MVFNTVDIIVLVVVVLFFLYGLMRGFIRPIITILGLGVAAALIYFLSASFGELLIDTSLGEWIESMLMKTTGILGSEKDFTVVLVGEEWVFSHNGESVITMLQSNVMYPSFMIDSIMANMTAGTLEMNIVKSLNIYFMQFIAGLIILVAVMIIFFIINIFAGRAIYKTKIGVVNRMLGSVLYLGIGVLFIFIAFTITSTVVGMLGNETGDSILEMMNNGMISKYITLYNPITMLLG